MLSQFIPFIIISALTNVGLMVLSFKWKVWQYLKIDVCIFCSLFWMAFFEFLLIYHEPNTWIWFFPIAISSAVAGSLVPEKIYY